jgi:hypothetical protein
MAQMGMFSNMFGMNPSNINLNADPSQMQNMGADGDLSAMNQNAFYAGFSGMQNIPQQQNQNGHQ